MERQENMDFSLVCGIGSYNEFLHFGSFSFSVSLGGSIG